MCDGNEDCTDGRICCARPDGAGYRSACARLGDCSNAGGVQLCRGSGDCANGFTCATAPFAGGTVSTCQK
jgi:hypothetical protein